MGGTQTYHLKLYVIDYSRYKETKNLYDMYLNLDNKKLLSNLFNAMVYIYGIKRFEKLLEANRMHFKYNYDEVWTKEKDSLMLIAKATRDLYNKRVMTKRIPFIYINKELFDQLDYLVGGDIEAFNPEEANINDALLLESEKFDREFLLQNFPHRYGKYAKFWNPSETQTVEEKTEQ